MSPGDEEVSNYHVIDVITDSLPGDDEAVVSRHPQPEVSPDQEVAHTDHSVSVLPGWHTGTQAGDETRQEDLAALLHLEGERGGDEDWWRPELPHSPPPSGTQPGLCSPSLVITDNKTSLPGPPSVPL